MHVNARPIAALGAHRSRDFCPRDERLATVLRRVPALGRRVPNAGSQNLGNPLVSFQDTGSVPIAAGPSIRCCDTKSLLSLSSGRGAFGTSERAFEALRRGLLHCQREEFSTGQVCWVTYRIVFDFIVCSVAVCVCGTRLELGGLLGPAHGPGAPAGAAAHILPRNEFVRHSTHSFG